MNYEAVLNRVIALIGQTLDDPDVEITARSDLLKELELESLEVSEIFSELEAEFGIRLSDSLLRSMVIVKDIADAVMNAGGR